MYMSTHLASDVKVSIVVNSTCDSNPPPSTVMVTHSPVTLTCCVEKCISWTGYWYRRTDDGTNQLISTGYSVSVNITEPEEMFICEILSYDDPACYDDASGQGNITLIACNTYNTLRGNIGGNFNLVVW